MLPYRPLPDKAVPVVLRRRGGRLCVLVFRHPVYGIQLVKGGIEAGESPTRAALRELWEEAGLTARSARPLGPKLPRLCGGPDWYPCLVSLSGGLPHRWSHFCDDEGGKTFRLFWHPLTAPPRGPWEAPFRQALTQIRDRFLRSKPARKRGWSSPLETPGAWTGRGLKRPS